jgi:Xaa-Pro aminopeptidase
MLPFDYNKLDILMEEARLELLLVTTRHNIRYFTGGYYNHFHARMARMAATRYLAVLGLPQGRPDDAFFVSARTEAAFVQGHHLWVPHLHLTGSERSPFFQDSPAASQSTAEIVRNMDFETARIGLELPFLPTDAYLLLHRELPEATFLDATSLLGELRAIKSEAESEIIRRNAAGSAAAIQATFASAAVGLTSADLTNRLQAEMIERGIEMQWILIAMGPDGVKRKWPSVQAWQPHEVLRLDSGSGLNDYLVDLCRMGCLGQPSKLADQLHANCLFLNDTLLQAIKPGMACQELYALGQNTLRQMSLAEFGHQITHGIGLVPHEPPTISANSQRVLAEGMVMSIETQYQHPEVGDVKIEDMVVVTANGCETLGHSGREWQIG